jgi:two-component system sensor histidine kinase DesK
MKRETSPPSGERALRRMRIYTSVSLVVVVILFCFTIVLQSQSPALIGVVIAASIIVAGYSLRWERTAPHWMTLVALAVSLGTWAYSIALFELPGTVALPAIVFGVVTFTLPRRLWWPLLGVALVAIGAPVFVASLVAPDPGFSWNGYYVAALIALAASAGFFALNRFAFGLYLEIDAARRVAGELAVVQERYRFAADLHDIQGHTLHVIRLKMQLTDRLLDKDPAAAHAHLSEAQELIAQTLADTRSLAFGDRHVAFASELANAEALLVAAGIAWRVEGALPPGAHDELFGLVMREATTNILRHAQARSVSVSLSAGSLAITNDGSPVASRSLSGLARLAERFEAAGGTLRTSSMDGTFSTVAELR